MQIWFDGRAGSFSWDQVQVYLDGALIERPLFVDGEKGEVRILTRRWVEPGQYYRPTWSMVHACEEREDRFCEVVLRGKVRLVSELIAGASFRDWAVDAGSDPRSAS